MLTECRTNHCSFRRFRTCFVYCNWV